MGNVKDFIKKYRPDTPKEFSFIGSSIARLGSAMSGVILMSDSKIWALATILVTWIGHEMAQYFKLGTKDERNKT